jgi:hypothetical protein
VFSKFSRCLPFSKWLPKHGIKMGGVKIQHCPISSVFLKPSTKRRYQMYVIYVKFEDIGGVIRRRKWKKDRHYHDQKDILFVLKQDMIII